MVFRLAAKTKISPIHIDVFTKNSHNLGALGSHIRGKMNNQPTSTIEAITDFLFIESSMNNVDLIFVFGNDWLDTMKEVKTIYEKGISDYILISGHSASKERSESEASRFMRKGVELGIPSEVFLLEKQATNTKENMQFSLPIIEEKIGISKITKILFVCKTFHTRRVLMTAKKFLPASIEYSFYPVNDERNIRKDNWWEDSTSFERVIAEVRRIAEYTLKGDLSIF